MSTLSKVGLVVAGFVLGVGFTRVMDALYESAQKAAEEDKKAPEGNAAEATNAQPQVDSATSDPAAPPAESHGSNRPQAFSGDPWVIAKAMTIDNCTPEHAIDTVIEMVKRYAWLKPVASGHANDVYTGTIKQYIPTFIDLKWTIVALQLIENHVGKNTDTTIIKDGLGEEYDLAQDDQSVLDMMRDRIEANLE